MELTHIRYFLEVARTEHVTQSAKTLCIVQPALTHALHKLEDEIGVKLFRTQGRNIKLTEAGEYFYRKAKPLYDDIDGQVRSILHHSIRCANPPAGEDITPESVIPFGSHRLTVIPCPGHTPGGVCYYCEEEKVLFSGDSLFQNSIGRTDFPGGNLWTLIDALKALIKTLPPDTTVYPGHGLKTTIDAEHRHNPYLFG